MGIILQLSPQDTYRRHALKPKLLSIEQRIIFFTVFKMIHSKTVNYMSYWFILFHISTIQGDQPLGTYYYQDHTRIHSPLPALDSGISYLHLFAHLQTSGYLTLSSLNLPLSPSSTTSRELLPQFSTCSG